MLLVEQLTSKFDLQQLQQHGIEGNLAGFEMFRVYFVSLMS